MSQFLMYGGTLHTFYPLMALSHFAFGVRSWLHPGWKEGGDILVGGGGGSGLGSLSVRMGIGTHTQARNWQRVPKDCSPSLSHSLLRKGSVGQR